MHALDRNTVPTPPCLAAPLAGRGYNHLRGGEKEEIRASLLDLQKHRCAYCERRTGEERDDGHIEHFRSQGGHHHLSLAWTNLFWSCNDEKTCGKHKDKCDRASGPRAAFDPNDLIDPCQDNPNNFLLFVYDGTVRPLEGLDAVDQRRAQETLRVFQLADSAYLRKSREDAVKPYVGAIDSLLSAGVELVVRYVQSEIVKIDSAPFATAIRQYLEGIQA
ncbi:TIGR02646 family protein [Rhizobiales bacterium GAS113]|nr:TIGR02646 family protein [Rhizobiales bacterium GAS113]